MLVTVVVLVVPIVMCQLVMWYSLSDDNGVASGRNGQTQASDNEVCCGSSEHPAPEEVSISCTLL